LGHYVTIASITQAFTSIWINSLFVSNHRFLYDEHIRHSLKKHPTKGRRQLLKIVKKLDHLLMKVEEFVLSYSIIIIAVMVVGNVISRSTLGSSWAFTDEISKFAVILATFLGIGYAARKGRHINMSAFFDLAPFKIRKALAIFIPAVTAIILFVLTYYACVYVIEVYNKGRVTSALQIPVWIMILSVPIGLFLGGIQFVRNAWINIKEKDVYLAAEQKDYS
jgi:C4-dicarboxylate transporter DctQ subunit